MSHNGKNTTHGNLCIFKIVILLRWLEELPVSRFALSVGLGSIVCESPRKPARQRCVRTVEQFLTFVLAKRQSRECRILLITQWFLRQIVVVRTQFGDRCFAVFFLCWLWREGGDWGLKTTCTVILSLHWYEPWKYSQLSGSLDIRPHVNKGFPFILL